MTSDGQCIMMSEIIQAKTCRDNLAASEERKRLSV